ncbi:MAG: hypothetical protein C0505_15710 [Leptothrix sp. (in: Bacteria)]|nr:hypothetical protein [Leptothrix sp. (in: b-proteobacteria)]
MKHPFLFALAAGVLSLLIAFAPAVWRMAQPPPPAAAGTAPASAAPWQVALPAPGRSQVFGLDLPGSTLAQAQQRWGDELALALIAGPGGNGGTLALEGYVERFEAGGVGGRLLLAFDAEGAAAALARWRGLLPGVPTASGARRHALSAPARAELGGTALVGLSFIASAQLSAEVLTARFGAPAERIAGGERLQHWLYPALGLAVALDAQGRDVLQYTAPADFERRLVAPLRAASAPR